MVPVAGIQEGVRLPFMSDDLRNSLKLWTGVIVLVGFMVIGGAVVRVWLSDAQLDDVVAKTPAWVWLLSAVWAMWSLGWVGWGLWRRRARA